MAIYQPLAAMIPILIVPIILDTARSPTSLLLPIPTTMRCRFRLVGRQGRLSLSLAYTWSHSLDDASDRFDSNFVNSYDPKSNYASSNFDQRQVLTASWVYDLPFFHVSGWKQSVLGGWQYSGIFVAQTGTPFSVVDGVFSDSAGLGNGNSTGSFADLVGNPHQISGPIYSSDPTIKGPLLFNPNAFAETTGLTQGTLDATCSTTQADGTSTWRCTRTSS